MLYGSGERGERHSTWLEEELTGMLNWLPWGAHCTPSAGDQADEDGGAAEKVA